MPAPILATKLYIPPPRPKIVHRPRLIEQMNLDLQRKLTLISAPAGFGKTTLVSDWIAGCQRPAAWLSLDEGDNDTTRFLIYLIAALQTLVLSNAQGLALSKGEGSAANIGSEALVALQSPQTPATESLLTSLLNEINTIPEDFALILDDYHLIDSQEIDKSLAFMLNNMPPQMHLVIATREDPQLPLARLRAREQLTELRAVDLRFTPTEAAGFLNQVMYLNLSAVDVAALEARTEGWITGLQLAAISMQGRADSASFIQAFTGSHHFVLDYLVDEVLGRQSESVRSFLLQTSLLDRLNSSLCDAVTGQDDSRGLLAALERDNLFVVPLDDRRQWYRYHHLFADVLGAHLKEEQLDQVPDLHRRASLWFEQNDMPEYTIRHALAAGDFERAADLAELAWPSWSGSYQSIAWLGWVVELPDELVRARPVLCVAYAWANLNAGDLEAAEERIMDAERWLDPAACLNEGAETLSTGMVVVDEEQYRSLPASLATARAYHAQAVGDIPGTMKHVQRVLELTHENDHQERGNAYALLGLAYWTSGDLEAAHRTLSDGLEGMHRAGYPLDVIVGTFVLADLNIGLGHLHQAVRECEQALQIANQHGEPMPLGTEDVYTAISKLHREWGDLQTAALDLAASKQLGEQVELPDWRYRWCITQAQLQTTNGDLDGALDLLDEAQCVFVRTPLPDVRPIAALKAQIWVKQGRLDEAQEWARERGLSVDDSLSYLREFEHITLARVLIARSKNDPEEDILRQASGLLERLLKAAVSDRRTGSVIEILALQALAQHAQTGIPAALESLVRALTLAEPEGYLRIFLDEGIPMAELLSAAAARGIMPDYSGKLLAVFEAERQESEDKSYLTPAQPLIEPLSERELEVLGLIAQGLSNREICERLFLAMSTVKGHNRKIYAKLEAERRTEAVARARELGLL